MSADHQDPTRISEDAEILPRQSRRLRSKTASDVRQTATVTREAIERSRKLLDETENFHRVPSSADKASKP
jgi:hypothetical protein